MAKWGEGDPRWIVEQRPDGTNVNNWHWTEKNATEWSKELIKSLLQGFKIENDTYECEIKEISKLEGEASANNRKAKLIFFYEWVIVVEWEGYLKGHEMKHKGKIEIPNLSEENDPSEIEVSVTTESKLKQANELKEFIRTYGADKIRDLLRSYVTKLKHEFSQGLILPNKDGKVEAAKESTAAASQTVTEKKPASAASLSTSSSSSVVTSVGVKIHCKKLTDSEEFMCRPVDIYRALTEQDLVLAFTRAPASIDASKGGRFEMFDGLIHGEFTELDVNKKIAMRWRMRSWPEEHYSNVTIILTDLDGSTHMEMTQTGVPQSEYERTLNGWKERYWQSIRQTFGFGARLY